jgi:AcrR family transcriptional regulator
MAIRPPKFDPAALISSIQMHGMPIAQIGREAGLSRGHVYRLLNGDTTRPSHDVASRLIALRDQVVTKAAPPAGPRKG